MTSEAIHFIESLWQQGLEFWLENEQLGFRGNKKLLDGDTLVQLKAHKAAIIQYIAKEPLAFQGTPLSHGQRGIYLSQQQALHSPMYNLSCCMQLHQPINHEALQSALNHISLRHPVLTASFHQTRLHISQSFHPERAIALQQETLADSDELKLWIDKKSDKAFALESDTLFKIHLITHKKQHYLLAISHHIVADFWALQQVMKDLQACYKTQLIHNTQEALAPSKSYKDFVLAEQAFLHSTAATDAKHYWQQALAEKLEPLQLPQDFTRPKRQSFKGDELRFTLSGELSQAIKTQAKAAKISPFIWLLSCYQSWLLRNGDNQELAIAIPIANRRDAATQKMAGHFTNPLPLFCKRKNSHDFFSLCEQNKLQLQQLLKHQQYPGELIATEDGANSRLYQTAFSWNALDDAAANEGVLFEKNILNLQRGAVLDLVLTAVDKRSHIELSLRYNLDIFNAQSIARFAEQLRQIIASSTATEKPALLHSDFRTQAEKNLLARINATEQALPAEHNLAALFHHCAAQYADAIALSVKEHNYSYKQLLLRSNDYAACFAAMGIGYADNIALHLPRGFELLAASIAALTLGAHYTPIDLSYPLERIQQMLAASESRLLVAESTQQEQLQKLQAIDSSLMILQTEDVKACDTMITPLTINPSDIACILFTSGSTGKPKPVAIGHQALVRLSHSNGFLQLQAGDKLCYLSNISFDASNIEIWCALLHGACLLAVDSATLLNPLQFANYIVSHKPQAAMITTALFNVLVNYQPSLFNSFDTLMIGGEAADVEHIKLCQQAGGPKSFYNLYGPTENGTVSTAYKIPRLNAGISSIPIGRPINNSQAYIVDSEMQLCPIGVKGELLVGGLGLANGYFKQSLLSDEKFIANFINQQGKLYRTGDLAYLDSDGYIHYSGRIDDQVKIRGFRIELAEVEHALSAYAGITQSCIDIRKDGNGNNYLAAFYSAQEKLDSRKIKAFLQQKLPEFMLPQAFKQLEQLPITANGKLDRKLLPEISLQKKTYVAASSDNEKKLCEIWQQAFNIPKIGIHDNFFDLGGHSLLAVKIAGMIEKQCNSDINMRLIFEYPDIESLALQINPQATRLPAIISQVAMPRSVAALSQQRLWFLQQLNEQSTTYNMPIAIAFNRDLKRQNIEAALNILFKRHDVLRYGFSDENGIAMIETGQGQSIRSSFNNIDLSQIPALDQEKEVQQLIDNLGQTVFKLDQAPLIKTMLIRLGPEHSILAFCLHHIITDGWSVKILLQELGALLQDIHKPLAPLALNYLDYSVWQHQLLQGEYLQQQLLYWQQQLADAEPTLNLPLDKPRPALLSNNGSAVNFSFNSQQSAAIRNLALQNNASSFMLLIASYSLLLARYCGDNDVCVGFPISGREQAASENIVGLFVNNLILRHQFDYQQSLGDYIQAIKKTTLAAYSHQSVPFDMIVDSLQIDRSLSYTPFLQASFSLEENNLEQAIRNALGEDVELKNINWHVAKYDIHLSCFDDGKSDISAVIEFNSDLFNTATIEQISQHYIAITEAICMGRQQQLLADIGFLSAADIAEQLDENHGLNATNKSYPAYSSMQAIIESQCLLSPDNIAVGDAHGQLNYYQLNSKANQLAHYLQVQGCKQGDRIAVCMDRSCELSIALLGCLKAGACYIPILPNTPPERIAYILQDTQAHIIISQRHLAESMPSLTGLIYLDSAETIEKLNLQSESNPPAIDNTEAIFNIIYTSGSTGEPKGVMVPQQGIINRLQWMQEEYPLHSQDIILQKTPFNFDVSVWELFWPLMVGASLYHAKPDGHKDADYLRDCIQLQKISVLHFVPSMLGVFLQSSAIEQCRSIAKVFTSGEALQLQHSASFFKRLGFAQLHNLYGPTEASIDVSYYPCVKNEVHRSIPIGKAIANTQLFILDEQLNLLPKGAVGELYIGGKGLALGYLNKPGLTEQAFIANPFFSYGGQSKKLYKSGDICRYLADGNIEYIGRGDNQVKIRGLRIELSEIEQQIRDIDDVSDTVVITHNINQQTQIIAFVVSHNEVDKHAYRHLLQQHLPDYMLPFAFIRIDAIPLSANGKIDRKQLPLDRINALTQTRSADFIAPRNETEELLQAIWQDILQVDNIGIYENFFELGGHSLLATRLASRVRSDFACALELKAIFDNPCIADLSVLILEQAIETLDIDDDELLALLDEIENDDDPN